MGKQDGQTLRKFLDRRHIFQNGLTFTSIIFCGGLIRSIIQKWMIKLSLGDGSLYHTKLGLTYSIG